MKVDLSEIPLGHRLKIIRVSRGRRQYEVAAAADLPPSTLSLIESGRRIPDDLEIDAILGVLNLSRKELGLDEVDT